MNFNCRMFGHTVSDPARWTFAFLITLAMFCMGCERSNSSTTKSIHIARPPFPRNYEDLVQVSNPGITEQEFDSFISTQLDPEAEPQQIGKAAIEKVRTEYYFNCKPFILNDELRAELTKAKQIRWLSIPDQISSTDLVWISKLENLHGLRLKNADLFEADLKILGKLKELRELSLSGTHLPNDRTSTFPQLPKLEVLNLYSAQNLTDGHLPAISQFPKLKSLNIFGSRITDDGLKRILKANPKLKVLNLGQCFELTPNAVGVLGEFNELRYLNLRDTAIERELFDVDYQGYPNLQRLIPNCHIAFGN